MKARLDVGRSPGPGTVTSIAIHGTNSTSKWFVILALLAARLTCSSVWMAGQSVSRVIWRTIGPHFSQTRARELLGRRGAVARSPAFEAGPDRLRTNMLTMPESRLLQKWLLGPDVVPVGYADLFTGKYESSPAN